MGKPLSSSKRPQLSTHSRNNARIAKVEVNICTAGDISFTSPRSAGCSTVRVGADSAIAVHQLDRWRACQTLRGTAMPVSASCLYSINSLPP